MTEENEIIEEIEATIPEQEEMSTGVDTESTEERTTVKPQTTGMCKCSRVPATKSGR